MGVKIPQVVTTDRASGAQVIDGSLTLQRANANYLTRAIGTEGNRRTWTYSCWIKRDAFPAASRQLWGQVATAGASATGSWQLYYAANEALEIHTYSLTHLKTNAVYRDTGWYHVVQTLDTTSGTADNRVRLYINGVEQTSFATRNNPNQNLELGVNTVGNMVIGTADNAKSTYYIDAKMAQCYFIDGLALGPENFGFTDPLTNTWRPKKYEGTFGTNGFYLPFDGSAPIGEDKSGQGNDWTPVNFGGSVALDNPQVSGARPILNTTQGGTQAGVGVFGSKENKYYTVTTANGSVYQFDITSGDNPSLSFIRGATYKFDYSSFTGHPVLFSSTNPDSSTTAYTDGTSTASNVISFTVPHNAPDTLYYYCQNHPTAMNGSISITTDETKADPYAWKNVLGLPLVGVKDDVSNQINSGSTTKVVTANGNVAASSALSNFYSGSFYFDGTDNKLTIPDNSDFSFGSGDYTIEMWVYPTRISGTQENLITRGTSGYSGFIMSVTNFLDSTSGSAWDANITYDNPLVANKWQHIAVCRYGDTWTVYINGVANGSDTASGSVSASGTLTIGERSGQTDFQGYINDIRLYKGVAKYTSNFIPASINPDILPDTPSGVSGGSKLAIVPDTSTEGAVAFDGNSDYLAVTGPGTLAASSNWCIECTFYCTGNSSGTYRIMSANESAQGSEYFHMRIRNGQYQFYTSNANSLTGTASFFKWTHIAMTKSGTTVRAYVDGVQLWSTTDNNTDSITNLITGWGYGSEYFPGFISNARFVNGSSVYTSEFNPPVVPLTNITNTAYLFCQSNTSATAYAVSPGSITANGTAAASKFTPFNTDINTVRGQETGYATLNPLVSTVSLSDGNLHQSQTSGTWNVAVSSIPMSTGKLYCEVTIETSNEFQIGIVKLDDGPNWVDNFPIVDFEYGWGMIADSSNGTGRLRSDYTTPVNGATNVAYGPFSPTAGDTISMAYDADNQKLTYFVNGINFGDTTSLWAYPPTSGEYVFANSVTTNTDVLWNFGQKPFKFLPPDGFQPLNAANIRPVKVISRPDQYVDVRSGLSAQFTISDLNFETNLMIAKSTSNNEYWIWADSVRGFIGGLRSNDTNVQGSGLAIANVNSNGYQSDSNWFSNGRTYVTYSFKAGGSKNTFNVDDVGYASAAAAGLDAGVVTPSAASVGTKQGFSILKYSGTGGQSCSHGLTQAPEFILEKEIGNTTNWTVQTTVIDGSLDYLYLNTTTQANDYNVDAPTSTLFDIGRNSECIAYLWHSVPGFSKFGRFAGNNSADGVFVELGFKPAILLIKNDNSTGDWIFWDNKRNPVNPVNRQIWPYTTSGTYGAYDQVGSNYPMDFLSNGFKMRTTDADMNGSSRTYIYAAWAEAPSVDLYGGGANAR